MIFEFTSSQKNFSISSTENVWNNGLICIFNKIYTYEQLNHSFNAFVEKFDSVRVFFNDKSSTGIAPFETNDYPFMKFDSREQLFDKSKDLINKPFDFKERLFCCVIFQTKKESGYIILAHHLILDGLSGKIMNVFLSDCLNKRTNSESIESYQQHIKNEERYINSKRYQKDRKFWSEQFSLTPNSSIFEEKKTSFDYASDEVNLHVCTELFSGIKTFCCNNYISEQSFFNTVYSTYILRTLGIDFFTIGVPVLNRTTQAELNTIGLYMHIVPLLVKISDGSFLENAINIEDSQLTLFRHQKFTQYDIKELLKEQGTPINSLFDIVADYQEFEKNDDYEFEFIYSNSLSVPLEIHMQSFGDEKHNLKIRYRTAMFTEKEIRTMMNSFIAIIEDALANPDKKITDLEMLSVNEKQKILYDFNNTAYSYHITENSTLYSLFEKTAKENESKICIRTAERELYFGELRRISGSLDAKIRKITKMEKSVIAVIAERSPEMYAAIYGIICGGNAYLPIDPDYPKERIDYILKNSGAVAAVVQGKFTDRIRNIPCIDMTEQMNCVSEYVPLVCAEPDDTAYVIYTSGSTGNPKGAKVSHRSAVNRILWMHDKYPLSAEDVILQKTPYTFDVSVWELFWWGMCGGSLVVSKPGEHFLPAKILDEVYRNKVTHIHFVPSVFDLLINYLEAHNDEIYKFESVKYVFLSGEALTANLVQRFYKMYDYGRVTVHNLYGPTECAVDVTYYDCSPDEYDPVPIGKPIYNTQMHVVDRCMNLCPIGVRGELCIAGMNVGQGYLNNPELTAERFIDNPFGEGKLYKTGDLAYWREDGNIIFCGRMDGQIKLNGQRIELGEIESVISDIPEVENAAVTVRRFNHKDVLVAFYCGKEEKEAEIKNFCREKLPKYMVPSFVVCLDTMPLNNNGKLDRKKLAKVEIEINGEYEKSEPINETERLICSAFENILGEKNIGRDSDFFEMGGTSLSMISLLSEKNFENITATEFMINPTPAMLSTVLNSKESKKFEYLEALYTSGESEKSLILLPFAGGGAEGYGSLVSELKKQDDRTDIYFIRYLHSVEECKKAADEIYEVLGESELLIYSHCVGSAVALQIISFLEKKGKSVRHYFAGASIPPIKPVKRNFWNIVPDKIIKSVLVKAGAEIKDLSDDTIRNLFNRFRKDTDFANISFTEFKDKITAPVSAVISKKDLFTKNYSQAEALWKKYTDNFVNISYIDSSSHYFQSADAEKLADILKKIQTE